eukprot:scaffold82618_cov63-Phaeocystis_antarctica.AAC.1
MAPTESACAHTESACSGNASASPAAPAAPAAPPRAKARLTSTEQAARRTPVAPLSMGAARVSMIAEAEAAAAATGRSGAQCRALAKQRSTW